MPELTVEESIALVNLMLATSILTLFIVVVCWFLFNKK